jgi:uncharacterized membrane protein YhaH (DUF805 family)
MTSFPKRWVIDISVNSTKQIPAQAELGRATRPSFWPRALLIIIVGVVLHYVHSFESRHATPFRSLVITGAHFGFLIAVPFIVAKSRGYVLARLLVLALWFSYMGLVARGAYLFFIEN